MVHTRAIDNALSVVGVTPTGFTQPVNGALPTAVQRIVDAVHPSSIVLFGSYAYGSPTPLKQLAQINTPDPQSIVIRPYDPGCLKDIEKAIRSSDLGMAPNNDGKMIRLTVPAMSGEQRQKMVARIKKSSEEAKVACRNIRRDGNKAFDVAEKDKEMTEDERDKGKEKVQDLLKSFEDKIADLADKKAKEVMEQ